MAPMSLSSVLIGVHPWLMTLWPRKGVDDVLGKAGVLDATMPPWRVIDGRRYWDKRSLGRAILAARDGPLRQSAA